MHTPNSAIDPLEGHIDRQLLSSFSSLLGPDTYATIADEVKRDLTLYHEGARSFARTSNSAPIRKFLHRLNGFAKQFGFIRLATHSTNGLAITGADYMAILKDCEEELAFLCAHQSMIFLDA